MSGRGIRLRICRKANERQATDSCQKDNDEGASIHQVHTGGALFLVTPVLFVQHGFKVSVNQSGEHNERKYLATVERDQRTRGRACDSHERATGATALPGRRFENSLRGKFAAMRKKLPAEGGSHSADEAGTNSRINAVMVLRHDHLIMRLQECHDVYEFLYRHIAIIQRHL